MDRNPYLRSASVDDPVGVGAVAAAVRDWEPRLELYRPPRDALLYEPDGTLYAACVGGTLSVRTDRRSLEVRPGDAIVIPQAYALDAGPDVDLLAFRYDGPPPDHFRERFIQVWGFEHFPAPEPGPPGLYDLIAASDSRHRIPYALADVFEADRNEHVVCPDLQVILGLSGTIRVTVGDRRLTLGPRDLTAVPPSAPYRLSGAGRVGIFTVMSELSHEARKTGPGGLGVDGRGARPEYRPPLPA